MNIGKKIRDLRKEKNMTLRELSEASGVALATLSRIETDKMVGTLESHKAIASTLGKNLPQLYSNIEIENRPVEFQSIKNRTDLFMHNEKASYYMLTNNVLTKKMMPVILKIAPGGKSTAEQLPKDTEKFVYILKGEFHIKVGDKDHIVKKGETLYFDASTLHYFKNSGHEEIEAICIITPPAL
jgi:transcriptional regulator with XRE-family HTH domain